MSANIDRIHISTVTLCIRILVTCLLPSGHTVYFTVYKLLYMQLHIVGMQVDFQSDIDEFTVGQIIFFGCVQMKRIARINNKKNEPEVLIHPHTPIYLRFCRFVVCFATPTMYNKTRGGISAKKTRYIALVKRGGVCYRKTDPPLLGINPINHARYKQRPICYQRYIISAKTTPQTL